MTSETELTRDELALSYLDQLPYSPYPFQEQAILTWFESKQGVLVCAPTGMGKTLVAEAGLYEALKTGKRAYYTTPLIALTEQKYAELQQTVERWGFDRSDVGLITGNRRENVDAKILVVVAEILFNRLLASDVFENFAKRALPAPTPTASETARKSDAKPTITAASLNAKSSLSAAPPTETKPKPSDEAGLSAAVEAAIAARPELRPSENPEERSALTPDSAIFSFDDVSVVVMDEFHQFADPERGVVWEFTLGLLPPHIRTLLISATVGNAYEFASWLRTTAGRSLDLVQSSERKVPLVYVWVGDALLPEHLESMCVGAEEERLTPALVFCFNRDECWEVAEVVKGKNVIDAERQKLIADELENYDLKNGAGPKLRQLLLRGVGVHHAGVLPKYRRIVESLFQKKLLSFCVCTETLAAGINLPARSVVLPTLMKGPAGDKKLVEASSARQIFGRAGRPQYDDRGYVFALAHEDDVRIARFKEKYDQIPDDVKDPKLREAKKKLKKKAPTRRAGEQYWSEKQFEQLRDGAAGKLTSRGPLPWRLLAHMIETNSDVKPIRTLVARRLMGPKRLAAMQKSLDQMLLTLWRGGFVRLDPNPAAYGIPETAAAREAQMKRRQELKELERKAKPFGAGIFDDALFDATNDEYAAAFEKEIAKIDEPIKAPEEFDFFGGADLFDETAPPKLVEPQDVKADDAETEEPSPAETQAPKLTLDVNPELADELASAYRAARAYPTDKIKTLTSLRGVNPLYGAFLLEQLGIADAPEWVQAFESLLETPAAVARSLRVPKQDELPPGPLATTRLDKELLQLGLASVEELVPRTEEEEREEREKRRHFGGAFEERVFVLSFAEKLKRLFDYEYPGVAVRVAPVWAAGELIFDFKGDFNKYILSKHLQKQEGVVFRHLTRLILLIEEFVDLVPEGADPLRWRADLENFARQLIESCREVDPLSVEETLNVSKQTDLLRKS